MDGLIIFLAVYLIYVIILLAVFTMYKVERRREFAAAVLFGGFLAVFFAGLAGLLYSHPRPFVSQNIEPLIAHGPDNAFPSQHTVLAMTLTSVIYFYRRHIPDGTWRRLIPLTAFVLTLLVGAGRVWAHVHWWIDIAGGLVVGAIAGYAGVKLAKLLLEKTVSAKNSKP